MDLVSAAPAFVGRDGAVGFPTRSALADWAAALVRTSAGRAGIGQELLHIDTRERGTWTIVARVGVVGDVRLHAAIGQSLSHSLNRLELGARRVWREETGGPATRVRPWLASLVLVPEHLGLRAVDRMGRLVAERTLDVGCVLAPDAGGLGSPTRATSLAALESALIGRFVYLAAMT
jgi:hypothetical protein